MDVHLRVIEDVPRPLRHNMLLTVHTGSSEAVARLRLLERQRAEPGESVWAQLKFETPVAVVKDDFFVVRSNRATLGGGSVVDTHTRRHRRNHQPTLDRLAMMEQGTPQDILLNTIGRSEPADVDDLPSRANMEADTVRSELEGMARNGEVVLLRSGKSVFTKGGWDELEGKALSLPLRLPRVIPAQKGRSKGGVAQSHRVGCGSLPGGAAGVAGQRSGRRGRPRGIPHGTLAEIDGEPGTGRAGLPGLA